MRRFKRWIIGSVVALVVLGVAIAFYYQFVDNAYSTFDYHSDVALVSLSRAATGPATFGYEPQAGRCCLVLSRGEPHGVITTEHGWWETVTVEIPRPSEGSRYALEDKNVRVALSSYKLRQFPTIGNRGVKGHVMIESIRKRSIIASYEIEIDGDYPRFMTEYRHQSVIFRGQSTFHRSSVPIGSFPGTIWPDSNPK